MTKNYVYKIQSSVVSDATLVVASSLSAAITKYREYWLNDQNRDIKEEDISTVVNEGEVIV